MTDTDRSNPLSRRNFLATGIASSAIIAASSSFIANASAASSAFGPKSPSGPRAQGGAQGATPAGGAAAAKPAQPAGPFELPPLPFKEDALAPYISANTMGFHYGKHHKGYVDKLNTLVAGKKYAEMPLEQVVAAASKSAEDAAIFNNAAQVWNHTFYWKSMKAGGGGEPSGKVADRIKKDFGSLDAFKTQFKEAATSQFGSGWAWIVVQDGKLAVQKTANADTPIARAVRPVLVVDVWEHAYYLDYQNKRPDYVTAFVDHLINWEFVEQNMG